MEISLGGQCHPHKRVQHRVLAVNLDGTFEKLAGPIIFFLLVGNIALAPPGAIMPNIQIDGLLKHFLGLGEILVVDMLVPTQ